MGKLKVSSIFSKGRQSWLEILSTADLDVDGRETDERAGD
jgi:hypothetical protein